MDITVRPTLTTKYFDKWKKALYLSKYTSSNLQEIVVVLHHIFCKDLWHEKNHDCTPNWPIMFFPQLLTMICLDNFLSNDQLSLNNHLRVCIFNLGFHWNDPIKLDVFDKTFLESRSLTQII